MRRRLMGLALSTVLAVLLIAAPAAADAADNADGETVVLAAAADEEPVGPEPQPRTADDNAATELIGYEDPETPFTWGAAWLLTFAGFMGLALLGGLYYLLVHRPSQEDSGRR